MLSDEALDQAEHEPKTYLPHVSREHPDIRERRWLWGVLERRKVRMDVIRAVMRRSVVVVEDWSHTAGTGGTTQMDPPARIRIRLAGVQEEAALHEFTHAHAYVVKEMGEWFGGELVAACLAEADEPQTEYGRIRDLCYKYVYGWAPGKSMWIAAENRWNDTEIWASLASGSMGDLSLYPPRLRVLYERLFKE